MSVSASESQIYDSVATSYDIIWNVPAVKILFPLLDQNLRSLRDWTGASVLDLACGTGIGLREARKLGATKLVGIDISAEMLNVCKATTVDVEQFELHQADCSKPLGDLGLKKGSFDLIIAMWLLNYAASKEEMKGMWENIATYLKPGGRFVGIIQNQDTINPSSMQHWKYGAMESNMQELTNGDGWKMHVEFDTTPKIEFDAFVMNKEILEGEAEKAGMKDLRYLRPGAECLTEEEKKDQAWWKELLDEYPNQLMLATKA